MLNPASDIRWYASRYEGVGVPEPFNSFPKTIGELLSANERAQVVVPEFQRGYDLLHFS